MSRPFAAGPVLSRVVEWVSQIAVDPRKYRRRRVILAILVGGLFVQFARGGYTEKQASPCLGLSCRCESPGPKRAIELVDPVAIGRSRTLAQQYFRQLPNVDTILICRRDTRMPVASVTPDPSLFRFSRTERLPALLKDLATAYARGTRGHAASQHPQESSHGW